MAKSLFHVQDERDEPQPVSPAANNGEEEYSNWWVADPPRQRNSRRYWGWLLAAIVILGVIVACGSPTPGAAEDQQTPTGPAAASAEASAEATLNATQEATGVAQAGQSTPEATRTPGPNVQPGGNISPLLAILGIIVVAGAVILVWVRGGAKPAPRAASANGKGKLDAAGKAGETVREKIEHKTPVVEVAAPALDIDYSKEEARRAEERRIFQAAEREARTIRPGLPPTDPAKRLPYLIALYNLSRDSERFVSIQKMANRLQSAGYFIALSDLTNFVLEVQRNHPRIVTVERERGAEGYRVGIFSE